MLRATTLLLLSLASVMPAVAAPRFAVVRITEIYQNLTSTQIMLLELQKDRAEILKDERAVHLRKVLEELKQLQAQLQAKRDAPVDDVLRKLAQQYEIKRQEGQTLQEEFQVFDAEKRKEINRKMVTTMRASLNKIDGTARTIAQEQGFDGAFDSSANSNTGVPILLYVKNAPDITKDVVARLQDAGEPSSAPGTTPAPLPDAAAPAQAAPTSPVGPAAETTPKP
ncbi:OmpH family outer membrane protein [Luteolibacter sp. SL250]|uniref:OmpH family outer membrane protein n=1 Tax=Luteolibacter sp. SL250 TaxID=2995170 RepID=UPI00226D51C2|nr:OmpH family outer membrane protein [Luteolibacter sp. SL250]WAC18228.1 OmpH family outer membrane protein [Luteolibacter sp. SL250]